MSTIQCQIKESKPCILYFLNKFVPGTPPSHFQIQRQTDEFVDGQTGGQTDLHLQDKAGRVIFLLSSCCLVLKGVAFRRNAFLEYLAQFISLHPGQGRGVMPFRVEEM